MTLPYKPISVSEGPITTDVMNQFANNDQWLFENMPRISYRAYGTVKNTGLKILATDVIIPQTNARGTSRGIYFSGYFSAGCNPIVVAQPIATNGQRRFFCHVNGIGRPTPDHNGCTISLIASELNPTYDKIGAAVYVHAIAIGW